MTTHSFGIEKICDECETKIGCYDDRWVCDSCTPRDAAFGICSTCCPPSAHTDDTFPFDITCCSSSLPLVGSSVPQVIAAVVDDSLSVEALLEDTRHVGDLLRFAVLCGWSQLVDIAFVGIELGVSSAIHSSPRHRTPLMMLSQYGYHDHVRSVIFRDDQDGKVDVDVRDFDERTALSFAAQVGHTVITRCARRL